MEAIDKTRDKKRIELPVAQHSIQAFVKPEHFNTINLIETANALAVKIKLSQNVAILQL